MKDELAPPDVKGMRAGRRPDARHRRRRAATAAPAPPDDEREKLALLELLLLERPGPQPDDG